MYLRYEWFRRVSSFQHQPYGLRYIGVPTGLGRERSRLATMQLTNGVESANAILLRTERDDTEDVIRHLSEYMRFQSRLQTKYVSGGCSSKVFVLISVIIRK